MVCTSSWLNPKKEKLEKTLQNEDLKKLFDLAYCKAACASLGLNGVCFGSAGVFLYGYVPIEFVGIDIAEDLMDPISHGSNKFTVAYRQ